MVNILRKKIDYSQLALLVEVWGREEGVSSSTVETTRMMCGVWPDWVGIWGRDLGQD